eukprot:747152-Hanusia_phi.AAC.2
METRSGRKGGCEGKVRREVVGRKAIRRNHMMKTGYERRKQATTGGRRKSADGSGGKELSRRREKAHAPGLSLLLTGRVAKAQARMQPQMYAGHGIVDL